MATKSVRLTLDMYPVEVTELKIPTIFTKNFFNPNCEIFWHLSSSLPFADKIVKCHKFSLL